jgi:glycosyltransferase involved in cell wall biosynthesis
MSGGADIVRGISVVICCHNSAERLPSTLAATFAALKCERSNNCELIIVDNDSSDRTRRIAEGLISRETQILCRIIKEPNVGQANARLAALSLAKGDVTCFIDDDNWPSCEYFQTIRRVFSQNPSIGVFGCSTRLPDGVALPPELSQYGFNYAIGHLYAATGILPVGSSVWGTGLALRTEPIQRLVLGGFRSVVVRRKGLLQRGDDSELVLALSILGWRVWYERAPLIVHAVDGRRFSDANLVKLHEANGASTPLLRRYIRRAQGQVWITGRLYPALLVLLAPIRLGRAAYRAVMTYFHPSLKRRLRAAESWGWMSFLASGWPALSVQRENMMIIERNVVTRSKCVYQPPDRQIS